MEDIRHDGIVMSVKGTTAHVKILQASACAGCHARNMCQGSDAQEKEMDCEMLEPLAVGDKVEVLISEGMGWKAVTLAYILPFVVLTAVVTLLVEYGVHEAIAGLSALAAAVIYYTVLWLMRGKVQKQFSFRAKKIQDNNK